MLNNDSLWPCFRRLRDLPVLARDLWASAFIIAVLAAGATLPVIAVPLSFLLVMPALLLAALAFGRASACLAALLTIVATRLVWFGPLAGQGGGGLTLLLLVALFCGTFGISALLEALWQRRTEATQAYARMNDTARSAALRLEKAQREVRQAQVRLTEAERKMQQAEQQLRAGRARAVDAALDSAFRSEGGI